MHGELRRRLCAHCGARAAHTGDLSVSEICPECGKPGGLRPDVVWFGEIPREMDRIHDALAACGIFVSIGTSGNVYPAAGFVQIAARAGADCVELNLERSLGADYFDRSIQGPASAIVPAFVARLLAGEPAS